MSDKVIKNIFCDLDETLLHTCFSDSEIPPVGHRADEPKEVFFPPEKITYRPILRPGANFLLLALRRIGNVFIVTRATHDYAVKMNELYGFGFPTSRIYSREHVCTNRGLPGHGVEIHAPRGKNYLIDDLPKRDNWEKIDLISQLGPVKYIKVEPFHGHREDSFTDAVIADIVGQIEND